MRKVATSAKCPSSISDQTVDYDITPHEIVAEAVNVMSQPYSCIQNDEDYHKPLPTERNEQHAFVGMNSEILEAGMI